MKRLYIRYIRYIRYICYIRYTFTCESGSGEIGDAPPKLEAAAAATPAFNAAFSFCSSAACCAAMSASSAGVGFALRLNSRNRMGGPPSTLTLYALCLAPVDVTSGMWRMMVAAVVEEMVVAVAEATVVALAVVIVAVVVVARWWWWW